MTLRLTGQIDPTVLLDGDLGALLAGLDHASRHWRLQAENRLGRRGYSCTVWVDGRRLTVAGPTMLAAARRALDRIAELRRGSRGGRS